MISGVDVKSKQEGVDDYPQIAAGKNWVDLRGKKRSWRGGKNPQTFCLGTEAWGGGRK